MTTTQGKHNGSDNSEVLALAGVRPRDHVADSLALLRRAEGLALRLDPVNGFWLAFSGGKDSQVLYHLAKEAGVRFKAFMSLTSVDPPEVIRFVRRNYPDVELIPPKASIYTLALRKRILPTMTRRWCCAEFKEIHGAGKVTLVGVRRQESFRRRGRGEVEVAGHRYSGTLDQFTARGEVAESCVNGRDKIIVSPMLDWTEREVWDYLDGNGIRHCELYDRGWRRIGCVLCPMETMRDKRRDMARYPHVREKWMEVIRRLIGDGSITKFTDPERFFRWWISNESYDRFMADNVFQQTIDFKN